MTDIKKNLPKPHIRTAPYNALIGKSPVVTAMVAAHHAIDELPVKTPDGKVRQLGEIINEKFAQGDENYREELAFTLEAITSNVALALSPAQVRNGANQVMIGFDKCMPNSTPQSHDKLASVVTESEKMKSDRTADLTESSANSRSLRHSGKTIITV